MVPDAPGKHRRFEAEPFSTGEYLASPVDAAGPQWDPGNGAVLGPQPSDIAGTRAVSTLPARVAPEWPPDLGGSMPWPQWDGPPPDLPSDHPSAPVPRVRMPVAPSGTGPSRGANPGSRPAQQAPGAGAPRLPQRQPGRQPSPASGRPGAHPQGYDTGQYPAQTGRPTRQGPRPNGRPQSYGPGPGNARPQGFGPGPAQGYDTGQYPAQTGRPTRQGPRPGARPQGFGPGNAPPQGYGPGNAPPQGYGPGPANAAAQGYALAQGYTQEPDYVPDPSQPHYGARRLYAVPDNATRDGMAEMQASGTVGFARQPGYDDGGRAAAIRQQALNEAAAIRQAAERDAASIMQEATALRAATEQEAARMRAVITSLSGQLSQMSAFATENLASPGGAPAALAAAATAALVAAPPAALPAGPATRPERPATRPRPATAPGKSTGTQGRQAKAAKKMVALLATLVTVGVVSGVAEIALHGGPFFIFRANGAGASETGPVENQGPGQPDAPGAHHVQPPTGKHAKN